MKLSHLLVGSALLACAGVVQAAVMSITVNNGSFETPGGLNPGGNGGEKWYAFPASAPGTWEFSGTAPGYAIYEIVNATAQHFKTAPNGSFVANGEHYPTMTQTLSYTVAAGDVFTLDFYVGQSLQGPGAGTLTASILVGASAIATDATFATTVAQGAWDHKTLTGTATSTGTLSISFAPGSSAAPWLDNVTMSVDSVPEPASLGLLSLAGIVLMRRRRRA